MSLGFWDEVDEVVRDVLVCSTSLIKDEQRRGLVFGVALVLADHVLRPFKKVFK